MFGMRHPKSFPSIWNADPKMHFVMRYLNGALRFEMWILTCKLEYTILNVCLSFWDVDTKMQFGMPHPRSLSLIWDMGPTQHLGWAILNCVLRFEMHTWVLKFHLVEASYIFAFRFGTCPKSDGHKSFRVWHSNMHSGSTSQITGQESKWRIPNAF